MDTLLSMELEHQKTLLLQGGELEIYAEETCIKEVQPFVGLIQAAWPAFIEVVQTESLLDWLDSSQQVLELELNWVKHDMMRAINKEYRDKDSSTDVLTFTLYADQEPATRSQWQKLPVIQLGTMFLCLDWGKDQLLNEANDLLEKSLVDPVPSKLHVFMMERFIHGMLHLLGQHHDTMDEYNKVVSIQHAVLKKAFGHHSDNRSGQN